MKPQPKQCATCQHLSTKQGREGYRRCDKKSTEGVGIYYQPSNKACDNYEGKK